MVGAVLNRITRHRGGYYGKYRYYASYYYQSKPAAAPASPAVKQASRPGLSSLLGYAEPKTQPASPTAEPDTAPAIETVPEGAWPRRPLQLTERKKDDDFE